MNLRFYILFFAIALSFLPSIFVSSHADICYHESELFRYQIQRKCPLFLYPNPPIEVDADLTDILVYTYHGYAYTSFLFYASWCPFSRALRREFVVLSSMFPQIKHSTLVIPRIIHTFGIDYLPSILLVSQTSKIRYRGGRDLDSLIHFYKETTGLEPVQYVDEGEPTSSETGLEPVQYIEKVEPTSSETDNNLITWLKNRPSIKDIATKEPFLVLAVMFLSFKLGFLISPIMRSLSKLSRNIQERAKAALASVF